MHQAFRLPGATGKMRRQRDKHQGSGRDWDNLDLEWQENLTGWERE